MDFTGWVLIDIDAADVSRKNVARVLRKFIVENLVTIWKSIIFSINKIRDHFLGDIFIKNLSHGIDVCILRLA